MRRCSRRTSPPLHPCATGQNVGTGPLGCVQVVCLDAEAQALAMGWFLHARGAAAAPQEPWVRVWARAVHHHSDAAAALPRQRRQPQGTTSPGFSSQKLQKEGRITQLFKPRCRKQMFCLQVLLRHSGLAVGCARCPRPARPLRQCPLNPVS